MRRFLLALLLSATPLTAQTASPLARAAGTITPADVAHRIGIIADDSMLGRDTPSRGLEMTAQYVADQFKRFGLKPGGDSSGWFQRYPITRRRLDLAASRIVFKAGATSDTATLARSARLVSGTHSPALFGTGSPGRWRHNGRRRRQARAPGQDRALSAGFHELDAGGRDPGYPRHATRREPGGHSPLQSRLGVVRGSAATEPAWTGPRQRWSGGSRR